MVAFRAASSNESHTPIPMAGTRNANVAAAVNRRACQTAAGKTLVKKRPMATTGEVRSR